MHRNSISRILQSLKYDVRTKFTAWVHKHRGVAIVWTAFFLLVLILFVGVGLDGAKVYYSAHQLQNAADAAALAGARVVKNNPSQAMTIARDLAYSNYAAGQPVVVNDNWPENEPNGEVVVGWYTVYNRTFEARDDITNAVKVVARRTVTDHNAIPLNFGPIVKVPTANVSRYAIAVADGGTGASLLALDCGSSCTPKPSPCGTECSGSSEEGEPGLEMSGNSIINVGCGPVPGEVQVNCSSCTKQNPAVDLGGGSVIEDALQMNVVGCYEGPSSEEMGFDIYSENLSGPNSVLPLDDPLGCWQQDGSRDCLMDELDANSFPPDLSPDPNVCAPWEPDINTIDLNSTDPCFVISPGYYSGGIYVTHTIKNPITGLPIPIYFEPGIYVLDGEICENINASGGLKLNGGILDASDGVMFYILGGPVDLGGNAVLTAHELVPWVDDGITQPYEGMLIYQDPDNCTPAKIIGTSEFDLVGTIYFPFNFVEIGGGGYAVGTQLIANSIWVHAEKKDGGVQICYDGRYRAPGKRSFLVE